MYPEIAADFYDRNTSKRELRLDAIDYMRTYLHMPKLDHCELVKRFRNGEDELWDEITEKCIWRGAFGGTYKMLESNRIIYKVPKDFKL